jgi:hypothetical protein
MSLFSDRNLPAAARYGAEVPEDVRQGLLDWFRTQGVGPVELWSWLRSQLGYGSIELGPDLRLAPQLIGAGLDVAEGLEHHACLSTVLAWTRVGRVPTIRLGSRHLRWSRPRLRQIRDAARPSTLPDRDPVR